MNQLVQQDSCGPTNIFYLAYNSNSKLPRNFIQIPTCAESEEFNKIGSLEFV